MMGKISWKECKGPRSVMLQLAHLDGVWAKYDVVVSPDHRKHVKTRRDQMLWRS